MSGGALDGLVYLDHMASTPLDPVVLEEMLPWMTAAGAGNPHAAGHRRGWRAVEAIEQARGDVAALLGARPGEILFTSGATEANALALLGGVPEGWPVLCSTVEHPSVLACVGELARCGHATESLPVDGTGRVDPDAVRIDGPALVSVMAANNEVGTVQPIGELARLLMAAAIAAVESGEEAINPRTLGMADYAGPGERRRQFERELM